jgi:hypothetical protein
MEPRFGFDFSSIRIHADRGATVQARSINAEAFTYGRHIVFDKGSFNDHTTSGRELLAHELTHVVQQSRSRLGSEPEQSRAPAIDSIPPALPITTGAIGAQVQRKNGDKKPTGGFETSKGGTAKEDSTKNSFSFDANYSVPLDPGLSFGTVSFLDKFDFKLKGTAGRDEPFGPEDAELQKLQLDLALQLAKLELINLKIGEGGVPGKLSLGGSLGTTGSVSQGFGAEPDRSGSYGAKGSLQAGLTTPSLLPSNQGKLTFGAKLGADASISQSLGDAGKTTAKVGGKAGLEGAYESPRLRGPGVTLGGLMGDSARIQIGADAGVSAEAKRETGKDDAVTRKLSAGGSLTLQGDDSKKRFFKSPFIRVRVTGDAELDPGHRSLRESNVSTTVTGTVGFKF